MPIDPKVILDKIRSQKRPLVKIHTGDIETMQPGEAAQVANQWVEEWTENPENRAEEDISPAALEAEWVETASWEHGLSWAHTQDDAEAWELQRHIILAEAEEGNEKAKALLPHFVATDAYNAFAWHGKWYHYGSQSLDIDEKYAASLCATKVAPSELDYVKLPWPCFVVRVPKFLQHIRINGEPLRLIVANHVKYSGLISVTGKQNMEGVSTNIDRYQLHLLTANKYRILPAQTLSQWSEPNPAKSYDEIRLVEVEYGERDRRVLEVIGRLVLGAIIAMNEPKIHKRYGTLAPGKKPSLGSPRFGTGDAIVLHKIGRPVKVDARETIAAYVAGTTGRVTNVRTLVAGHWKNQPHGPKSTLRRWQHVECYWRGDEEAPRIIRPHVITGSDPG
jgi:hypothetical protein